jgi:hypothetical protein
MSERSERTALVLRFAHWRSLDSAHDRPEVERNG